MASSFILAGFVAAYRRIRAVAVPTPLAIRRMEWQGELVIRSRQVINYLA
jgi:hypothetical protein